MTSDSRLMLLDTASLYFRAFFGVPDSVRSPDGKPVNAVRGLLDFIARLVGDYQPTHLVCCWDNDWRPQWRVDLLPSYKGHRVVAARPGPTPDIEEVPDPLEAQIPLIVKSSIPISIDKRPEYQQPDVFDSVLELLSIQSTMFDKAGSFIKKSAAEPAVASGS